MLKMFEEIFSQRFIQSAYEPQVQLLQTLQGLTDDESLAKTIIQPAVITSCDATTITTRFNIITLRSYYSTILIILRNGRWIKVNLIMKIKRHVLCNNSLIYEKIIMNSRTKKIVNERKMFQFNFSLSLSLSPSSSFSSNIQCSLYAQCIRPKKKMEISRT